TRGVRDALRATRRAHSSPHLRRTPDLRRRTHRQQRVMNPPTTPSQVDAWLATPCENEHFEFKKAGFNKAELRHQARPGPRIDRPGIFPPWREPAFQVSTLGSPMDTLTHYRSVSWALKGPPTPGTSTTVTRCCAGRLRSLRGFPTRADELTGSDVEPSDSWLGGDPRPHHRSPGIVPDAPGQTVEASGARLPRSAPGRSPSPTPSIPTRASSDSESPT